MNPSASGQVKPQIGSDMKPRCLSSTDHVHPLIANPITMCQATNNKTTSKLSFGKIRHAVVTHCFELYFSQLCHSIQLRFVGTTHTTSNEMMASDNENSFWMRAGLCQCGWCEPQWFEYGWICADHSQRQQYRTLHDVHEQGASRHTMVLPMSAANDSKRTLADSP